MIHALGVRVTSSRTKDVCSCEPSTPVKVIAVLPEPETVRDFWTYPEEALRLEYVARVVPRAATVSLSYAVEVVVSAVSTCSQKLRVAPLHPAGTVTVWASVSVVAVP